MLRTRICDLLGIEVPIICAPLGPDLSGPDLVGAVSGAGGLGILQAQLCPPALLRGEIRRVREITDRPFGVNFILHFPHEEGVAVAIEERVPILSFFWGDPSPFIERAHRAGARVLHQVGNVAAARGAAAAGVDVVMAQGSEAGGHLAGDVSTMVLVPRIVDAVAPTPVAAEGGIADGRGIAAALALGAEAAVLGTRFLATSEANAHPLYKSRIVDASEEDTVRTVLFGGGWPGAPHRVLRTAPVREWAGREDGALEAAAGEPPIGETKIAGMTMPLLRFASFPPNRSTTGEIEAMSLLAGQSAGLVHDQRPAGRLVRDLAEEAGRILGGGLAGRL